MATYTLREACERLGVEIKTLHVWMERAGIEPRPDPVDHRKKVLTAEQVDELARIHRRDTPHEGEGADELDELRRRLDELERRVRELERGRG